MVVAEVSLSNGEEVSALRMKEALMMQGAKTIMDSGILDDVEKTDYLLDAAVYPEWKQIQKKSPNDNLYDQLIQFVKFYQSDFGFDMSPLMTILEQEEIKEEFDKRLKNS